MAESLNFKVFAMKLQPGGAEKGTDPYEFCKEEKIVGVGWGIDLSRKYETVDEIYEQHEAVVRKREEQGKQTSRILEDGRLHAPLRYILKKMDEGDFVWVKEKSKFALCKINSGWEVTPNLPSEKAEQYAKRDIHHFRYVEWVDIPYEFVPGYARRKFSRPFGTASKMDDGITADSKQVLRALNRGNFDRSFDRERLAERIRSTQTDRIFDILGPGETEDIVISYLQSEGWRIIKSSTNESEAKIECEMRKDRDGNSILGYVQVKSGSASLNPSNYMEYAESGEMIFFVPSGVDVDGLDNLHAIKPETIHQYMSSAINYLPNEPLLKLDYAL